MRGWRARRPTRRAVERARACRGSCSVTPSLPRSCSSAGAAQRAAVGRRRAPAARAHSAIAATRVGVPARVGRLGVDDRRERVGDAVQAVVVGAQHAVGGLELGDALAPALGARRRPRSAASSASGSSASTSAGSRSVPRRGAQRRAPAAPAPPAPANTSAVCARRARAPAAGSTRPRGRRGSRCRPSARRARGSPAPSPRAARACARRRRRARSAAGRSRARRGGRSGPREPCRARATGRRRPGATLRADVGGEGELGAAVDQRALLLDDPVVAAEQRRDVGGVRRAAGVLEQQRVVERRAVVGRQVEGRGEAHADDAGPLRRGPAAGPR